MDPLHAIAVTLFLYVLTMFNPGANLFIVVQTTLNSGKKAGLICGYGIVLGDAIYSGLGLFGLVAVMHQFEAFFSLVKIAGGAYLFWYAVTVFRNRTQLNLNNDSAQPLLQPFRYFRRGLISDLSNPQTILFFISIFSVTLTPQTPLWTKLTLWAGIITASLIWRIILCNTFSLASVRRTYSRIQRVAGKVIGVLLGALAARLIYQGAEELLQRN